MANRGVYRFHHQEIGTVNGNGDAVLAGAQSVVWQFRHMDASEFAWWTTTLLGGAASLTLTSAELWDHTVTEQTFTDGVVYLPTYEAYRGGRFWNVTVQMRHLLPLVLS